MSCVRDPARVVLIAASCLLECVVGCGRAEPTLRVEAFANQDIGALTAGDIAAVLRRAGLSDEQILSIGPDVRNGLSSCGAVQVRDGKYVDLILAIDGPYLHGASRHRGNFIYDFQQHAFR